jgi:hypothetical protein
MYTQYFLVPHIACTLIAQDLDCSIETAYEEMIASGDVGKNLQPEDDDDPELEKVFKMNMTNIKRGQPKLKVCMFYYVNEF